MENVFDELMEKQGLTYEALTDAEKETYNKANFATQKLTVADLIDYVTRMKDSIGLKLATTSLEDRDMVLRLQARLNNYILMESFLRTPEKAEEALKRQIKLKESLKAK